VTQRVDGLLPRVADSLGLTFVEMLGGGEFGAALVTDADGRRLVLKAMPGEGWAPVFARGAALSARVRDGAPGYPIPAYVGTGVAEGGAWSLQEHLPGEVPPVLTAAHAHRLVELVHAHADRAEAHADADPVGRRLALELDGSVDRLAARDDTAALAATLGRALDDPEARALTRRTDVVHGDYHHGNVLAAGDAITAVFDWELAYVGDWRIDLLNLACWSQWLPDRFEPDATAALVAAAEEVCEPPVLARFTAIHALRQLDFDLRVHPDRLHLMVGVLERALFG
jgi:aminoglycoside phosphotransferase (APT) family kinase protein